MNRYSVNQIDYEEMDNGTFVRILPATGDAFIIDKKTNKAVGVTIAPIPILYGGVPVEKKITMFDRLKKKVLTIR